MPKVPEEEIDRFLRVHRLPDTYTRLIDQWLLPLADWLYERVTLPDCRLLGINGAQGTGKSTLAEFLKLALEPGLQGSVAVLSIDDFYLTKTERKALGRDVHWLLETRGVPGTHDLAMLDGCLSSLQTLRAGEQVALPRFDKAKDDRADESSWPTVAGPVSLIILEGWCVGSTAQASAKLGEPLNALEDDNDPDAIWRRFVNTRLGSDYAALFARIDTLVFLQAPSFKAVYRWRVEQERKLAASNPNDASGVMSEAQVAGFIRHYERITCHNLETLPSIADVTLELDEDHQCRRARYRAG